MKNRKRRVELLSFYDHVGISRHLEKMAAKGWMLEKITNLGWVYRRIEPKQLHFTVSYYSKASEFDPEPTEDQKTFYDFCAHTGWQLACSSAQLQIFYNERENPTPIETDAKLEVQAIHASAKKSFIPAYLALLVIALLNGGLFVSGIMGDPIKALSSPSRLFSGFAFLVLAIICLVELICYFGWFHKAKAAAEYGEFLKTPHTATFQKIIMAVILFGALYWIISYIILGSPLERWVAVLMCIYMPALFAIVNAVKQFLKQKKAAIGVNRTVTMLSSFVLAFAMMALITFGTLYASSHGVFREKNEETYKHGGITWVIHHDNIPLTVEDLLGADNYEYIKERTGSMSFMLGQFTMSQYPRFDEENYADIPQLEYTLTEVRIPALYNLCKNRLIYEQEELYPLDKHEYKAEDGKAWGANEAYRLYDLEYGVENKYLLCYDNLLVEIDFDWEPTAAQKAVVSEKLGSLK